MCTLGQEEERLHLQSRAEVRLGLLVHDTQTNGTESGAGECERAGKWVVFTGGCEGGA